MRYEENRLEMVQKTEPIQEWMIFFTQTEMEEREVG